MADQVKSSGTDATAGYLGEKVLATGGLRAVVEAVTPPLEGIAVWLKGDDLTGADLSSVDRWVDPEHNVVLTQPNPAKRPVLRTGANGINGLNVVDCTRSTGTLDQYLQGTLNIVGAPGFTAYYVMRTKSPVQSYGHVFGLKGTGSDWYFGFGSGTVGYAGSTGSIVFGAPTSSATNTVYLAEYHYDKTTWTLDGVKTGTFSDTSFPTLPSTVYLGSDTYPGLQLDGQIGEILVYRRALSSGERADVKDYLAHKWGLDPSAQFEYVKIGYPDAVPSAANFAERYVHPSGDDANDGRRWETAKRTILAAYDSLSELPAAGAIANIYIHDGSYVGGEVASQGIWLWTDRGDGDPGTGWRVYRPCRFIGVGGFTSGIGGPNKASIYQGNPGDPQTWDLTKPLIWAYNMQVEMTFENLQPATYGFARFGVKWNGDRSGLTSNLFVRNVGMYSPPDTSYRTIDVSNTDNVVASTHTWNFANGDFSFADVGTPITITGSASNNGTYTIVSVTSAQTIVTDGTQVNETFAGTETLIANAFGPAWDCGWCNLAWFRNVNALGSATEKTLTVTGADGVVAATKTWTFTNGQFFAGEEGCWFTVTGASNGANNGTFYITEVVDRTTVKTADAGLLVTETFSGSVTLQRPVNLQGDDHAGFLIKSDFDGTTGYMSFKDVFTGRCGIKYYLCGASGIGLDVEQMITENGPQPRPIQLAALPGLSQAQLGQAQISHVNIKSIDVADGIMQDTYFVWMDPRIWPYIHNFNCVVCEDIGLSAGGAIYGPALNKSKDVQGSMQRTTPFARGQYGFYKDGRIAGRVDAGRRLGAPTSAPFVNLASHDPSAWTNFFAAVTPGTRDVFGLNNAADFSTNGSGRLDFYSAGRSIANGDILMFGVWIRSPNLGSIGGPAGNLGVVPGGFTTGSNVVAMRTLWAGNGEWCWCGGVGVFDNSSSPTTALTILSGAYQESVRYCYPLLVHIPAVTTSSVTVTGSDSVVASTKTWTFANGAFSAADIGAYFTVAGASNGANNGTFTITEVVSSTAVKTAGTAAALVNETFSAPPVTMTRSKERFSETEAYELLASAATWNPALARGSVGTLRGQPLVGSGGLGINSGIARTAGAGSGQLTVGAVLTYEPRFDEDGTTVIGWVPIYAATINP